MKREMLPSRESLVRHAEKIPEINPSEVIAMLRVMQAAGEIQHAIIDVLEKEHQLSEGKLCVLIVLHQEQDGLAPSVLAKHAGVSRATISVMLRRMIRDGLVFTALDAEDARFKKICLTEKGRQLME